MSMLKDDIRGAAAYFRDVKKNLPEIAAQSGYSRGYITRSFLRCYLQKRISVGVFRSLRLYEKSAPAIGDYLTLRQCIRVSDRLNAAATPEDLQIMGDKHLFNAFFREFIHRDWLYLPDSTPAQIEAFLERNGTYLMKTCSDSQGIGIRRFTREETDPAAFIAEYGGQSLLLEAFLEQHPALSAVNPSSVNTVRMITARRDDQVLIVGAGLRCGGAGQFVDNYHHGGAAYPIDLESGVINGRGIDLDGNPILRHPSTGHIMPGLQLPYWSELLSIVNKAALLAPRIGYVGWDLAFTPEGVELIEGNVNYPGTTIIQIDGPVYRKLRQFVYSG